MLIINKLDVSVTYLLKFFGIAYAIIFIPFMNQINTEEDHES